MEVRYTKLSNTLKDDMRRRDYFRKPHISTYEAKLSEKIMISRPCKSRREYDLKERHGLFFRYGTSMSEKLNLHLHTKSRWVEGLKVNVMNWSILFYLNVLLGSPFKPKYYFLRYFFVRFILKQQQQQQNVSKIVTFKKMMIEHTSGASVRI